MMWWNGSGYWWVGALMMFAFWGGLILVVFLLVRGSGSSQAPGEQHRTPLEILAERFARGEISKEEYEERKSVLRNDLGPNTQGDDP